MISLGARFTEYGLTGGLFLFAAFMLLICLNPPGLLIQPTSFYAFVYSISSLPEAIQTLGASIGLAVLIVCLFFTGLLLELLGSVFIIWEVNIFRRQLKRGEWWVRPLLKRYSEQLCEDMDRLMNEFGEPLGELAHLNAWLFWKREHWRNIWRGLNRFRPLRSYGRMQAALLSHLLINAPQPALDSLSDQLRLCRVARAVSTALVLLSSLTWFLSVSNLDSSGIFAILGGAGTVLLWVIAIFLTLRAYSRFCLSFFSLLLVHTKSGEKSPRC